MKKQALFVTEKWCDGIPSNALTNSFHNLFNTFAYSCDDYIYNTLHLDESAMIYNKHIDDVLLSYCNKYNINIIIYCFLGPSPLNPSINTLKYIKEKGIYQCVIWPDSAAWAIKKIKEINDYIDINILLDMPSSAYHNSILPFLEKTKCMWTPQDNTIFCDNIKTKDKDIDVSFIGSNRYPDRQEYVSFLQKHLKSFVFRGGQREENLSIVEYSNLIKRSKISINFASNPDGFWQTKGRIYEILSCNSLLLESSNPSTRKVLSDTEYSEFSSPDDLLKKIDYYLNNSDKRIQIAQNGFERYHKDYSSKVFWDTILRDANI